MTTLKAARDAAIKVVDDAWKASTAASKDVPMHYDNVKADRPGEDPRLSGEPEPYARTTVRITGAQNTTVSKRKRYLTTGAITVQVFTPIGDGHDLGDDLVQVVLDALRGHSGSADGIWFFDVEPAEIGEVGPHFQTNVNGALRFTESYGG